MNILIVHILKYNKLESLETKMVIKHVLIT